MTHRRNSRHFELLYSEGFVRAGLVLLVGRVVRPFVPVVPLALVAIEFPVEGKKDVSSATVDRIDGGAVGDIGVEEDHVAGISLKQHILILWLVRAIVLAEGLPFLAHEGLFVVAGIHEAERAVVQTVLVLHDLHCDVKFSVGVPAGSLVLVQFVRSVTGKLVIDLILEKPAVRREAG